MSDLFESGYEKRFGCLWIDEIKEGVVEDFKGYACEVGQSPYLVKSIEDVSKKVIWWSNIPAPTCWSYGRFKTLKSDEYLGLSLNQLVLSYCVDQDEIKNNLGKFADIFKRFYHFISENFYKGQNFNMSDGLMADHFLLSRNKKETDLYQESQISLEEQEIANRSFLEIFKAKDYMVNKKRLSFSLPPSLFFKSMKNIDMPKASWEIMNIDPNRLDITTLLKEQGKPYMVKIKSWQFFDEDLSYLMDRNQNQHINRNYRDLCWYTQNEFEYLLSYAKPDIEAIYLASQKQTFEYLPEFLGEMEDYSLSAQLYWTCWWQSYSKICRHPYTRKKLPVSPEMSWINAEQRIRMLKYVLNFHEEDFIVDSYGNGQITVWCDKEEAKRAVKLALSLGFIVPANLLPEIHFFEKKIDLNPMLSFDKQIQQYICFNSMLILDKKWLDLDYMVMPEFEKNAAHVLKQSSQELMKFKPVFKESQKTIYDGWLTQQARTAVNYVKRKKLDKQ